LHFYRILADPNAVDRWFLDEPVGQQGRQIDARAFLQGSRYIGPPPADVPIQRVGREVTFNLAAFDMPVVSGELGRFLLEAAPQEIELFPVTVGSTIPGFAILNVVSIQDCLDETKSNVLKWKPEDARPDKVGQYRMVTNLTIDPQRTSGRNLFRVAGWKIALIVSEKIKAALDGSKELGIVFESVVRPG
jgi:hypothetical protein